MIRYELGGVIETVDSRISSVMVGNSWSAILTIDSATMDTNPDAASGVYNGPSGLYAIGSTVAIDPTQFSSNTINVIDRSGIAQFDILNFEAQIMGPLLDGFETTGLQIRLLDLTASAFSNDNLSETLGKSFDDFISRSFLLRAFDPDPGVDDFIGLPLPNEFTALEGTVTSYSATVVPIPPAILLFVTALLGMFGFTRKKVI
jgi:hypothetical protein